MGRFGFLLVAALALGLPGATTVAPGEPACTSLQRVAGACATIVGDQVVLGATRDEPGSRSGQIPAPGLADPAPAPAPGPPDPGNYLLGYDAAGQPMYRSNYTVTSPVRLADLVGFRPSPGTSHMEPAGWMVVGLDTNFYAAAGTQVQQGELLGQPASVRFTPLRYRWTYGDGSSGTRTTSGASWAASGVAEFDPTPTSHVYRSRGTYAIDLVVEFGAEYRYAGGEWTSIAGVLPVAANRLTATAGDAKTVLVNGPCGSVPRGPGC